MISLRNLTVRYPNNPQPAISDVNLEVPKGSLTVLFGGSGTGKTSLFRTLSCELPIASGDAVVGSVSLRGLKGGSLSSYRRSVGLLNQEFKLLVDRTVEENVALPLEIIGVKATRRKERVLSILERFSLLAKRNDFPKNLSTSEQQRVLIARAVVAEPLILLADDPTAHLDSVGAEEVIQLIRNENFRGMTVLLGTSDDRVLPLIPEATIVPLGERVLA